jgi:hypothetical protein
MIPLAIAGAIPAVEVVGNVIDKLFTSDEERLDKKAVLAQLALNPGLAQIELNKAEATHKSTFVAGWRPAIGWTCGAGLALAFVINPIFQWWTGTPGPQLPLESMTSLVTAMLGLGGLRTFEKIIGKTK